MTEYKEVIFNLENGTVEERAYSEAEIAQVKKGEQEAKAIEAELVAKEAARQSALSKLIDLGLTEEEIAAL